MVTCEVITVLVSKWIAPMVCVAAGGSNVSSGQISVFKFPTLRKDWCRELELTGTHQIAL